MACCGSMIQYVFIIGATGHVGRELVRQIIGEGDWNRKIHKNPTIIVGVASRDQFLFSRQGLPHDSVGEFSRRERTGEKYSSLNDILKKVHEEAADDPGKGNRLIFIDATAVEMLDFHRRVLRNKRWGVVTANKIPLAGADWPTFEELTSQVHRYGFRCSVMAGADVVNVLQDFRDVNDPVREIYGCFSGTLGYVCTELEKGKEFSAIVKDAKVKGYTEPHPRDDLNGVDVARKLLILSRTAGFRIRMEDVKVEPFIPRTYLNESDIDKFLEAIGGLDNHFRERVLALAKEGKVLRYVGRLTVEGGKPLARVGIEETGKGGTLGMLKGRDNKVAIVTKSYPSERPYRIEVPGAGLEITAQNIRRELLYLLENRIVRTI